MSKEKRHLPTGPHSSMDLGDGHSIATWVAVAIALVGFILGTWAVVTQAWTLLYVSMGILVVALIAGRLLSLAGFGEYSRGSIDAPADKDSIGVK